MCRNKHLVHVTIGETYCVGTNLLVLSRIFDRCARILRTGRNMTQIYRTESDGTLRVISRNCALAFMPNQALADIGGLTKCSKSPAFDKRLKTSVKN